MTINLLKSVAYLLCSIALVAITSCGSHPTPTLDAQKAAVRAMTTGEGTTEGNSDVPAEGPTKPVKGPTSSVTLLSNPIMLQSAASRP